MTIRISDPPGANRNAILGMLNQICPTAGFAVDPDGTVRFTTQICAELISGNVSIINPCRCLCDIVSFGKEVRITVRRDLSAFGGGVTLDDVPNDSTPGNSPTGFGAGTGSEVRIENRNRYRARSAVDPTQTTPEPDWLILAHELCGHALPNLRGDHPEWRPGRPGYNPNWHNAALNAGRAIRAIYGLPPILEPPFT